MCKSGNYLAATGTLDRRGILCAIVMIFLTTVPLPGAVAGHDTGLHQQTAHYSVYLGVVPARLLKEQPKLVDMDKTLHGGLMQEPDTQHLTISVFDAGTEKRITDVTVIAEVRHKKWMGGRKIERPLEKMFVGGTVTYGNFFRMAERGEYEIRVRIYRPDGEAGETASFRYKKPEEQ